MYTYLSAVLVVVKCIYLYTLSTLSDGTLTVAEIVSLGIDNE